MGKSVGIIGAGITGLAAAYVLSPKHEITIVARDMPGDFGTGWASPWFAIPLDRSLRANNYTGPAQFSTHSRQLLYPSKACRKPASNSTGPWLIEIHPAE